MGTRAAGRIAVGCGTSPPSVAERWPAPTRRGTKTQNLGRAATEITAAAPPVALRPDLGQIHIFGLQAFRPLLHFKGYARTLVERFISASRNGGKMDEHIFAILALDKSKSFCGVKPLHCSGFFQDDSFCDLTPDVSIEGGAAVGIRDSKAGPSEFKGCTRMITISSLTLRPRDALFRARAARWFRHATVLLR